MTVDGYGVESAEVDAIVESLVGQRDQADDDEVWFAYLSSRQALLLAAAGRVSDMRDSLVNDMVGKSSERDVADRLNLSPSRPGQLARRARRRSPNRQGDAGSETLS